MNCRRNVHVVVLRGIQDSNVGSGKSGTRKGIGGCGGRFVGVGIAFVFFAGCSVAGAVSVGVDALREALGLCTVNVVIVIAGVS